MLRAPAPNSFYLERLPAGAGPLRSRSSRWATSSSKAAGPAKQCSPTSATTATKPGARQQAPGHVNAWGLGEVAPAKDTRQSLKYLAASPAVCAAFALPTALDTARPSLQHLVPLLPSSPPGFIPRFTTLTVLTSLDLEVDKQLLSHPSDLAKLAHLALPDRSAQIPKPPTMPALLRVVCENTERDAFCYRGVTLQRITMAKTREVKPGLLKLHAMDLHYLLHVAPNLQLGRLLDVPGPLRGGEVLEGGYPAQR